MSEQHVEATAVVSVLPFRLLEEILLMLPVSSSDSSRSYIAGVHVMAHEGKTLLRATNGHMAARRLMDLEFPFQGQFMVRAEAEKSLRLLVKKGAIRDPQVVQVPGRGLLVGQRVCILFEEYKDTFPDLDAVVPKFVGPRVAIALNAQYLADLGKALGGFGHKHVRLSFDPTAPLGPYLVETTTVYSADASIAALMPLKDKQVEVLAGEMAAKLAEGKGGA
jgi:hypothetical protein